jgi:hypothetical protein
MPQSLSTFNQALKEVYEPGLRNAVNNSNVVWSEAIKNTEDLVGEEAVWSIHSGRSNSTGARGELAALPAADRQRHLKARSGLTFQYHTVKVSGPAKHLTRNDSGSFARALESEIKGAEKDMKNSLGRQVFGQKVTVNGALRSGVVATVSAKAGATVTVGAEDSSVLRHFFAGMLIRFVVPATGAFRTGTYEVVSVNKTTKVITLSTTPDAAVVATDFIVVASSDGGTSLGNEIDGLRHLISTQAYAGIDPATQPVWAPLQVGSTSTGISEVLLDEASEVVETDGDGSSPDLYIFEHVQRRKLASQLQAQKRYEGRDTTLTSGWKGLQIARGTLVADRFCPTTWGFNIHRPEIQKFIGLDFEWDDDDGDVLYKALDGSDAVEARFKGYVNLAATLRNCHVQIRVSEPSF